MGGFGRRFAAEVVFIVLVAVGLGLADLHWSAIVLLMAAAWLLTALVEWVAWRRGKERVAPGQAPPLVEAPAEQPEPPALQPHVRVLGREPKPEPVAEEAIVEPVPEPVAAAPEPEPEPEPEPTREPEPQMWNVWELDRIARGSAGRDRARDEELSYLLVYLRDFANPEGLLPLDFDALVRESFGELFAEPSRG